MNKTDFKEHLCNVCGNGLAPRPDCVVECALVKEKRSVDLEYDDSTLQKDVVIAKCDRFNPIPEDTTEEIECCLQCKYYSCEQEQGFTTHGWCMLLRKEVKYHVCEEFKDE